MQTAAATRFAGGILPLWTFVLGDVNIQLRICLAIYLQHFQLQEGQGNFEILSNGRVHNFAGVRPINNIIISIIKVHTFPFIKAKHF